MVAALDDAGLTASVSNSAGTFVCNHVFYGLQHALKRRRSARSGFMHLPCRPEQAAAGLHSMTLTTMVEGVGIALTTALTVRQDLAVSAGRLD